MVKEGGHTKMSPKFCINAEDTKAE